MKIKLRQIESAIDIAMKVLVKIGNLAILLVWGWLYFTFLSIAISLLFDFAIGLVPGLFPVAIATALKAILLLAIAAAVVNDLMKSEEA